jgi:ABC-2 type transport system permease protein
MASLSAQVRFDLGNWLRNGEQAILNILLPLGALAGSTRLDLTGETRAALIVLFTIGASSFTSIAIATAFDRRAGALKVYGISPLGKRGFVQARILSAVLLSVVQIAAIVGVSFLAKIPLVISPALLMYASLSIVAWISLALMIASLLRAEAVLAVANLLFIASAGLTWMASQAPTTFAVTTPMSSAMAAAEGATSGIIAIGCWAVATIIVAIRTLRWE